MKKVILHVGLHKTATTFLQKSVWPGVRGYTYLTRPYTQNNHAFNQLQYADDSLYERWRVDAEVEALGADRLLISDESLSGKPLQFSYVNRSAIAHRLRELFPDAEIVAFIRDQRDILASHYSAYLNMPYGIAPPSAAFHRRGRDYTYQDFLAGAPATPEEAFYYTDEPRIHLDGFRYTTLIKLYRELFPACHVFLYEDLAADSEGTVARLSEILGEPVRVRGDRPRNVSLSPAGMVRRRRANRFSWLATRPRQRRLIRALMAATPVLRVPDVHSAVTELVGDYFAKDNRLLREQFPELGLERHPGKYA